MEPKLASWALAYLCGALPTLEIDHSRRCFSSTLFCRSDPGPPESGCDGARPDFKRGFGIFVGYVIPTSGIAGVGVSHCSTQGLLKPKMHRTWELVSHFPFPRASPKAQFEPQLYFLLVFVLNQNHCAYIQLSRSWAVIEVSTSLGSWFYLCLCCGFVFVQTKEMHTDFI